MGVSDMINLIKRVLYSTILRVGSTRTVLLGPCRGIKYRIFPEYGLGYLLGRWEPGEMQRVCTIVRPGAVAYDLGANFGMYSLLLARLVGPSGIVFSFEPVPGNIEELTANVKLNHFDNVFVIPKAAAAASGTMSFEPSLSTASGHLVSNGNSGLVLTVKTTCIDDFVLHEGHDRPDFIKMDVEGSEGDVLAGAREVIRRYQPVMMIELHNPQADLAVGKFLNEFGYVATHLPTSREVENITSGWPDPQGLWGRILATPRQLARRA